MLRNKIMSGISALVLLVSCNTTNKEKEPAWSALPEVTNLEQLKQTDFAITLEDSIAEGRNIIYAPAFLYAWDKVEEELRFPVIVGSGNSAAFGWLNRSATHTNALNPGEYEAAAQISDGAITATAFFNTTLPFERKMQELTSPIRFDSADIAAFGMKRFDKDLVKFTSIVYYKDDDHFIVKLSPEDKQREIMLVKGLERFGNLLEGVKATDSLITLAQKEQTDSTKVWKHVFDHSDELAIPVIKFNIAAHYKSLEGQQFTTGDKKQYRINEAWQRTGFILNANGAVVESQAAVVVDSVGRPEDMVHPKKLILDKPFLIIIKRIDKTNPYFVMKVANAELLMKK